AGGGGGGGGPSAAQGLPSGRDGRGLRRGTWPDYRPRSAASPPREYSASPPAAHGFRHPPGPGRPASQVPGGGRGAGQRSVSPRMNFSTASRASSSPYCSGGDFMK